MEDFTLELKTDWEGDFNAAMDSVVLLNAGKREEQSVEEWAEIVQRNVEHLKITVAKDWPEGYDLTPFHEAIAANA